MGVAESRDGLVSLTNAAWPPRSPKFGGFQAVILPRINALTLNPNLLDPNQSCFSTPLRR